MNYLIKGAGRCGSQAVMQWLGQNQNCKLKFTHGADTFILKNTGNWAVHDHYCWIPTHVRNWVLVYCTRKNKFDQSLSRCIAEKTNQWNHYRGLEINEPITIPFENVWKKYKNIIYYDEVIMSVTKQFPWREVIEINQEDMSPQLFAEKLCYNEIGNSGIRNFVEKFPYKKREVVKNYIELRKEFKRRQKQDKY
jgi:hypothetical protein